MSAQHSIIEHRANYFYIKLEDDYLAMCEKINQEIEALGNPDRQTSGPADCKAMILAVLEGWTNSKRLTAKSDEDLYIYLTYGEWEQQLRYRYKRSTIVRCLMEMHLEGQWFDEKEDEVFVGTIKRKPYIQNTYAYALNVKVVQGLLSTLPEQSPYGPRPKSPLGRPQKSRIEKSDLKINGINLNGLKTDGNSEIPSENTRNNPENRLKTNAPFYTQITRSQITDTQIGNTGFASATPTPAPITSEEKSSLTEETLYQPDFSNQSSRIASTASEAQGDQFGNNNTSVVHYSALPDPGSRPVRSGQALESVGQEWRTHAPEPGSAAGADREPTTGTGRADREDKQAGGGNGAAITAGHTRASQPALIESEKPRRGAKKAEEMPVLTEGGQIILDAWSSLFKVAINATPAIITSANNLYHKIPPWSRDLKETHAQVLDRIQKHLYATDKSGYYRRGVKLFDVDREFEAWQSAMMREEKPKSAAKPIATTNPYSLVALLQERNIVV